MNTSANKVTSSLGHFDILQFGLVVCGQLLLYVYCVLPFEIDKRFSIISLTIPSQAEAFGTVWPYFGLIHVIAIVLALALVFLIPLNTLLQCQTYFVYCLINLGAIFLLVSGIETPRYWDYSVEFLRLSSLATLAILVLAWKGYKPDLLIGTLLLTLTPPILLFLTGNISGFVALRDGRINAPGLEITTTGHAGALAVLLALSIPIRKSVRVCLFIAGMFSVLASGSRIAFALTFVFAVVLFWRAHQSIRKRVAAIAVILICGTIVLFFASSGFVAGGRFETLFQGTSTLQDEYTVGRGMALLASIEVIKEHPLGFVDSDWAIQEQLLEFGFPSHTHSNIFQTYLRYGPVMFAFWALLATEAWKGLKKRSPYAIPLWFLIAGSFCDYYGDVTKMMLFLFMVAALNSSYVRERSAEHQWHLPRWFARPVHQLLRPELE